jgi:exosortase F-associated protein
MQSEWSSVRGSKRRIFLIVVAFVGLAVVFLFQQIDVLKLLGLQAHPFVHFSIKKLVRVFLNDTFMLMLLYGWFYTPSITRLAWKIQLIDTFLLLPLYLLLKLVWEGDSEISSPLLSQFHRLIVNPTLMILIIPAVYYQRFKSPAQK